MDAQETSIYHAILITGGVLGAIIIYFIISITRQQRKNLELHRGNILAEITSLEKERARIAHDLHDDLGPLLSAVKMKINSFALSEHDDQIQIEKTNTHIDDILKRIREISYDLMPNSLLRKGLIVALKEFTDYLDNNNRIKFIFHAENDFNLSEQKAINVYRIVQEITHNAIKHASATEFKIELKTVKNNMLLMLCDNGCGFDYENISSENIGFGLRGILSRTEIIGGQMYLDSNPGKGTTYNFEIPL